MNIYLNTLNNNRFAQFVFTDENGEENAITLDSTLEEEIECFGEELNWWVFGGPTNERIFCNEEEAVAYYNALVKLHEKEAVPEEELQRRKEERQKAWEEQMAEEETDDYSIEE